MSTVLLQRGEQRREARLTYTMQAFAWQRPEPNLEADVTFRVRASLTFAHAIQHVGFHFHTRLRMNDVCEVRALPEHVVRQVLEEAFEHELRINGRTHGRVVWAHDQMLFDDASLPPPSRREWSNEDGACEVEEALNIIYTREIQDWPLEINDPAKIDDAIALYEGAATDGIRFAAMSFVLYSIEGAPCADPRMKWVEDTLSRDFALHAAQVHYWARWHAGDVGDLPMSLMARRVFEASAHPIRVA
jgi:hypothetical protein